MASCNIFRQHGRSTGHVTPSISLTEELISWQHTYVLRTFGDLKDLHPKPSSITSSLGSLDNRLNTSLTRRTRLLSNDLRKRRSALWTELMLLYTRHDRASTPIPQIAPLPRHSARSLRNLPQYEQEPLYARSTALWE